MAASPSVRFLDRTTPPHIATLILIAAVANIVMFPHPMWMNVAAFVAPLLGGLVGARLAGEPARRAEVVREPAGHA